MPGDHLILSSTDALAEDLIDALEKEAAQPVKPLVGKHSVIEIDGRRLASILAANREGLVRNNMVEEGNTREEAEAGIDVLLMIVGRMAGMRLDVGDDGEQSRAGLALQLNMDAAEKGDE